MFGILFYITQSLLIHQLPWINKGALGNETLKQSSEKRDILSSKEKSVTISILNEKSIRMSI